MNCVRVTCQIPGATKVPIQNLKANKILFSSHVHYMDIFQTVTVFKGLKLVSAILQSISALNLSGFKDHIMNILCESCKGRIFSCVPPFYEQVVSDLDRSMHRSLWA